MALIARDDELAELVGRVRNNRLVTLVGPGGIVIDPGWLVCRSSDG